MRTYRSVFLQYFKMSTITRASSVNLHHRLFSVYRIDYTKFSFPLTYSCQYHCKTCIGSCTREGRVFYCCGTVAVVPAVEDRVAAKWNNVLSFGWHGRGPRAMRIIIYFCYLFSVVISENCFDGQHLRLHACFAKAWTCDMWN